MSAAVPVTVRSTTRGARAVGMLRGTGAAGIVSAIVIAVAIFLAIFGTFIAPYDPITPNLSLAWVGPVGGHLLGYDFEGRDVLSRLIVGARTSMLGPLAVVLGSMIAGSLLAVAAAWRGGALDAFISSGLDVLFAFPGILLAVLAAAVFGAGLTAAAIALSIAYMPYVARVLRGAALKERNQPYVAALEVQGASGTSICLRHLIPNIMPLIVAQATILFGYAMVDLAAISFLGLGVQPPEPNWGVMISENQVGIPQGYPLPALAACVCIVAVVIAFNVLGERLFEQAQAAPYELEPDAAGPRPATRVGAEAAAAAPGRARRCSTSTAWNVRLPIDGIHRPVLREVSFSLRPGEAFGLVGESGSGKSMTARAIDRLLPAGAEVTGSIRFDGRDVGALAGAGLRRYRGQVAMIFQDPRAHTNPVRRIGDFMTEALRTNHVGPGRGGARPRRRHARPGRASRTGRAGSGSTRTSCRAACCSG